jgi:cytochrome c556
MRPRRFFLAAMAFLAVAASGALAQDSAKNQVEYRQAVMRSQDGHAAAIAKILKGQVDYKDQILPHAKGLAATAPLVAKIFPEGSGYEAYEKTNALPKIWEDPEGFKQATDRLAVTSATLLEAAESGDEAKILAAFQEVGKACGGCHDKYRYKE